jgi:hypothetical protein
VHQAGAAIARYCTHVFRPFLREARKKNGHRRPRLDLVHHVRLASAAPFLSVI